MSDYQRVAKIALDSYAADNVPEIVLGWHESELNVEEMRQVWRAQSARYAASGDAEAAILMVEAEKAAAKILEGEFGLGWVAKYQPRRLEGRRVEG